MTYSNNDSSVKTGSAREEDGACIQRSLKPIKVYAVILVIATVIAVFINFMPVIQFNPPQLKPLSQSKPAFQWPFQKAEESVEEAPKVIYIQARPSAEPTPPPAIISFKLITYGRELDADGFTTYVGDKPVVLTVEMAPFMSHPPIDWSVSDDTAASLSISNDRKQCEFSALRDAGKIELTVRCNEAEIVIPVYVWETPAT